MYNLNLYYKNGLILIMIFFLTQNFYSIENSKKNGYSDINNYLKIAKNGLDTNLSKSIPYHHLERWPVHVFIGKLSKLFKLEIHELYIYIQIILITIVFIVIGIIKESYLIKLSLLSSLIFNPYLFRLYNCIPEMISDTLFVIGSLIFIISILYKKKELNILSLLILLISRQTVLLIFPIIVIMYLNKIINRNQMILNIFVLSLGLILLKTTTFILFEKIENKYIIYHFIDGWKNLDNNNFIKLLNFLYRFLILIITISPFYIFLNSKKYKEYIIWLLIFFIINIQPLISGPIITSGNIQRLGALGIPFLLPIIIQKEKEKIEYLLFIILNIILSFHHRFSILNHISYSLIIFEIIMISVIIILLIYKYAKK